MRFRSLGTTGLQVSELGLGCSSLGASVFQSDEARSVRVLEAAFDNGINFFDTAGSYAYGRSEALLGLVFSQRRDKVI
ncbi:MAG: aldo/keto reductase, partial [Pseudomonadota bacterium]|nr:aldo/keto reductase [Pseudomonadota bacterium]